MTTRFTLNDWGEDDLEIFMLAISSYLPNYRLAHNLNKVLSKQFEERVSPLLIQSKNETYSFVVYEARHCNNELRLFLLENSSFQSSNKGSGSSLFNDLTKESQFFINKQNQWNYLLFVNQQDYLNELQPLLKGAVIIASQPIDFKTLSKDRQNIINELFYENER